MTCPKTLVKTLEKHGLRPLRCITYDTYDISWCQCQESQTKFFVETCSKLVARTAKQWLTQTRSRWRLKLLRSEPRICLRENKNKEKQPFLKVASSERLARVLESLDEL